MFKKKIRPKFNSKMPDWGTTAFFFTRESDAEFKKQHPKAYGLLCFIGITVLFLPMLLLMLFCIFLYPAPNSGFLILAFIGAFSIGIGFFNIVGAWIGQYLGHKVTAFCLLIGAALTAIALVIMYVPDFYRIFDEAAINHYFIQLIFCMLPPIYYVPFRVSFSEMIPEKTGLSEKRIERMKQGMRNYWLYESIHQEYDLGFRYMLNKVFLYLYVACTALFLLTGWHRVMIPVTTGAVCLCFLLCIPLCLFTSEGTTQRNAVQWFRFIGTLLFPLLAIYTLIGDALTNF